MSQCKYVDGNCNLQIDENSGNLKCMNNEHILTSDFIIGKSYYWEKDNFGEPNNNLNINNYYGEPVIAIGDECDKKYYGNAGYSSLEDMDNGLKNEYNELTNSVAKNKGFYIGRYETSLSENGKAQSKPGKIPSTANNPINNMWYGLYRIQKEYSSNLNSVKSCMLYGSQYDTILKWALTGKDKDKVSENKNGNHNGTSPIETGSYANDKINNIYDLEGNVREWTQMSWITNKKGVRVGRGGKYNDNESSPLYGTGSYPYDIDNGLGSRITLYIVNKN